MKRILSFIALAALSSLPFTNIVQAQSEPQTNSYNHVYASTKASKPVAKLASATIKTSTPAQPTAAPEPTPVAVPVVPAFDPNNKSTWPTCSASQIVWAQDGLCHDVPVAAPSPVISVLSFGFAPMGTYGNGYDAGQCTWGAASMKGDIPNSWGNANNWAAAAAASGYAVSSVPVLGAVAQTSRGSFGHVAVVTGINGDGTITVTEMNYDGSGSGLWRSRGALVSEFVYIYM
jgi:surface antigen